VPAAQLDDQTPAHVVEVGVVELMPVVAAALKRPLGQTEHVMLLPDEPAAAKKVPAGQLVDHAVQPPPELSVSQPLALYVPGPHAAVPAEQLLHVLDVAPVQLPEVHTQPEKSVDDVELAGHVPAHVVATVEPTLIAVAWNVPDAHAVQATSDVGVPSAET